MEVLSWGSCYVLPTYGSGLLRVSSFILWVAVCVGGLCVAWLLPVGVGERKCVRILWVMILGICVKYYGEIM